MIYTEEKIQEDLILLSSYTERIKLVTEVAYKSVLFDKRDKLNIYKKERVTESPKTRRFDLVYKDKNVKTLFVIELKKDIINALTISEIIGERGYLEIIDNIEEEGIEQKKLIFSNPKSKGLTIGAKRLINDYKNVSYISIEDIAETIFKCYVGERLEDNAWRDKTIRDRFSHILLGNNNNITYI